MELPTLWIPSFHDDHLRALYRRALVRDGWRVGAWRRTEVKALREGVTHACLPTGAGTFFVPARSSDLADLALALSREVRVPLLAIQPASLVVYAAGALRESFRRKGADAAVVARALGVPAEQVALLLDAKTSVAQADTTQVEGAAWELTSLRLME